MCNTIPQRLQTEARQLALHMKKQVSSQDWDDKGKTHGIRSKADSPDFDARAHGPHSSKVAGLSAAGGATVHPS